MPAPGRGPPYRPSFCHEARRPPGSEWGRAETRPHEYSPHLVCFRMLTRLFSGGMHIEIRVHRSDTTSGAELGPTWIFQEISFRDRNQPSLDSAATRPLSSSFLGVVCLRIIRMMNIYRRLQGYSRTAVPVCVDLEQGLKKVKCLKKSSQKCSLLIRTRCLYTLRSSVGAGNSDDGRYTSL